MVAAAAVDDVSTQRKKLKKATNLDKSEEDEEEEAVADENVRTKRRLASRQLKMMMLVNANLEYNRIETKKKKRVENWLILFLPVVVVVFLNKRVTCK